MQKSSTEARALCRFGLLTRMAQDTDIITVTPKVKRRLDFSQRAMIGIRILAIACALVGTCVYLAKSARSAGNAAE
jgi:hypothetical protein